MELSQAKNASWLFFGQIIIKLANFLKQILLAYFLGVSAYIDLFLVAQIVPSILSSMIGGGAGEILITSLKKNEDKNNIIVVLFTFCISIITVFLGIIYLFSIPLWLSAFNISSESTELFITLSIIVVVNKLPTAIVASLKNLLYIKNLYRFYIFTSLSSEIIGILVIVLLVNKYGIIAFALGALSTSTVNAIIFFNIHGLSFRYILSSKTWNTEWSNLRVLLKKVLSISMQVMVSHLSTFWERILGMRYLTPGYLSALNYSKSLSEMPKMIFLTSILTTTYVEQVKKKEQGISYFYSYSNQMEGLLNQISAAFQVLSIILAPFILILFLRRGEFDNSAVESTFNIYQILTIGFLPGLMLNFLSRTMYAVGKFKQLLFFIVGRFVIEILLMYSLIKLIPNAIPIALTSGKFLISIFLFIYLERNFKGIFNKKRFGIIYFVVLIFSIFVLFINQKLLPMILLKSNSQIVITYIPVVIVLGLIFLFYINYLGYLNPIIQKIKSLIHGKS